MINVVMVGRIATVGEVRQKDNLTYCRFSIVSDHYSKHESGYVADFVDAVIFGKRAESLAGQKGALVEVTGTLESSKGKKNPTQTFWSLKVQNLVYLKKVNPNPSGKVPVKEEDDYPF